MAETTEAFLGSAYSQEDRERLRRTSVDLPDEIISFFQQYVHNYLPGKHSKPSKNRRTSMSYLHVEGLNAEPLPSGLLRNEKQYEEVDEWPVRNKTDEDEFRTHRTVDALAKKMFGQGVYENVRRWYKVRASTRPIRVNAIDRFTRRPVEFYVKCPDLNRLIGKFIYDIITHEPDDLDYKAGRRQVARYAFNRAIFVEETVEGKQVTRSLDERLLAPPTSGDADDHAHNHRRYVDGLARAAVHVDFLGVFRDVSMPANRIVDMQYRTCLFDFNIIYNAPFESSQNPLLQLLLQHDIPLDGHVMAVFNDEMRNVRMNLQKSDAFRKFVGIVGSVPDFSGMTLDERIRTWYNATSYAEYVEKKIDEYKQMGRRMRGSDLRKTGRFPKPD